jgi:hypothetical protein
MLPKHGNSITHWEISLGVERQPEYGNNIFAKKPLSFPEDNLVSIQAVREYLAFLWVPVSKGVSNFEESDLGRSVQKP